MGQEEIYKVLLNNKGKKFTIAQLAKRIGVSDTSISTCLLRLRRRHEEINHEYLKHNKIRVWIE